MARIKDTSVEAVKAAADIVAVVEERTPLRKQGARLVGRCPFHEERTPSFSVNPGQGLYYCFGCHKGGDLISFVRETQGLDFAGAIEWLAERFRIPLEYEDVSPEQAAKRDRRARLAELLDDAASFYERALWETEVGSFARDYLEGRGFSRGDRARLPARPLARRRLARRARRSRRDSRARSCSAAGLMRPRGDDYFQRRLMFPLDRCARACARLPGAQALRRRSAARQVREHAGVGAVPQERRRLRARQGAGGDREAGSRLRRRGERRRDRAPPGGVRAGRRVHGHRAHRAAAARARPPHEAAVARVRRRRSGRVGGATGHGARGGAGLRRERGRAPVRRRPGRRPVRLRSTPARKRSRTSSTAFASSWTAPTTAKPASGGRRRSSTGSRKAPTSSRRNGSSPTGSARRCSSAPARSRPRAPRPSAPRVVDAGTRLERNALAGRARARTSYGRCSGS